MGIELIYLIVIKAIYDKPKASTTRVPLKIRNKTGMSAFTTYFLIGVTLVNKIIQVSGAQFYNTSSVHCSVCSPPQVKSPSITIYPPYPPPPLPPWQSWHCCPCPWVLSFFPFLFNPRTFPTSWPWQLSAGSLALFSVTTLRQNNTGYPNLGYQTRKKRAGLRLFRGGA